MDDRLTFCLEAEDYDHGADENKKGKGKLEGRGEWVLVRLVLGAHSLKYRYIYLFLL